MKLSTRIKMMPYRIKNKIFNFYLVKKYPWLHPMTWVGEEWVRDPDYGYEYIMWFTHKPGWWKAFGRMFCDEVQEHFQECPNMYVMDEKEKWGQLRVSFADANSAVDDICEKYETISTNVCYFCGCPHTYQTNAGWVLPVCPECYTKQKWGTKPYLEVVCDNDPRIHDIYRVHHYSKDGDWDEDIDISDTVRKIEENYDKNRRSFKRFFSERFRRI